MRRSITTGTAALLVAAAAGTIVSGPETAAAATTTGGLAVSYADPPPALVLAPYARIDIPVPQDVVADLPQAAVLPDGGVVLVDDRSRNAYLVGNDGSTSGPIALDVAPSAIVASPGPVVYGLVPDEATGGLLMAAVALTGPQAGRVVANAAVAGAQQYLELPIGAFGNTPAGVVDRTRAPGTVMIGHVDLTGAPSSVGGLRALLTIGADGAVVDQGDGALRWPLTIERHPESPTPFAGESPPAPSADGVAIYTTSIGPAGDPGDDLSPATLPVVALLEGDGGGAWFSIPFGWTLVASDVGATVFARRTGSTVDLARLDPSLIDRCDGYRPNDRYPIRLCDSGPAVRLVQQGLRVVDADLDVDGYFGPLTDRTVREFQRQNGLEVDGLVGPLTWRALTAGIAVGRDADASGVIDPWELGAPDEPAPPPDPSPGFPPANAALTQGGETWAVVLAGSADMEDPALQEARVAAEGAGYFTGPTDCDRGAAEALGLGGEIVFTVSVYFSSEADARSAQAGFASRGIPGVVAVVTTFCLD